MATKINCYCGKSILEKNVEKHHRSKFHRTFDNRTGEIRQKLRNAYSYQPEPHNFYYIPRWFFDKYITYERIVLYFTSCKIHSRLIRRVFELDLNTLRIALDRGDRFYKYKTFFTNLSEDDDEVYFIRFNFLHGNFNRDEEFEEDFNRLIEENNQQN